MMIIMMMNSMDKWMNEWMERHRDIERDKMISFFFCLVYGDFWCLVCSVVVGGGRY